MLTLAHHPARLHAARVELTRIRRAVGVLLDEAEPTSCTADDTTLVGHLRSGLTALDSAAVGLAAAVVGLDAEPIPDLED